MDNIVDKIIELLDAGNNSYDTRDIICKKYGINHGNYIHIFVEARQKMGV